METMNKGMFVDDIGEARDEMLERAAAADNQAERFWWLAQAEILPVFLGQVDGWEPGLANEEKAGLLVKLLASIYMNASGAIIGTITNPDEAMTTVMALEVGANALPDLINQVAKARLEDEGKLASAEAGQ